MNCNDDLLLRSRYYSQLLRPFGFLDFIGMLGLWSSGSIAGVHACRFDTKPRYGERDVGLFQLHSSHVCKSLTISDVLDLHTLKFNMLEVTLNELSAGIWNWVGEAGFLHPTTTGSHRRSSHGCGEIAPTSLDPMMSTPAKGFIVVFTMITI